MTVRLNSPLVQPEDKPDEDGSDKSYLARLQKYVPAGSFTIYTAISNIAFMADKGSNDRRTMVIIAVVLGSISTLIFSMLKTTAKKEGLPKNKRKVLREGSSGIIYLNYSKITLMHALTSLIAFQSATILNPATAQILQPGIRSYWIALGQYFGIIIVLTLSAFVCDNRTGLDGLVRATAHNA